jgi:hypothetical protein
VTRRVNIRDQWQAVYTAGIVLPQPVSSNRYWHRSLNPKKLIEVAFSRLQRNMTMAGTIKVRVVVVCVHFCWVYVSIFLLGVCVHFCWVYVSSFLLGVCVFIFVGCMCLHFCWV